MRPHATSAFFIAGSICLVAACPAQAQAARESAAATGADAVGQADAVPNTVSRPPKVAPLFEQPGVLTPRGTYVLEPAFQYAYSSSPRMASAGYALIPALFPPAIDVREVRRNTTVASLTARRGITNRFEVELRVPYIYRRDTVVSPAPSGGMAADRIIEASGKSIGDVELAARYQLNEGGLRVPYFVGGLRVKSHTGRDPFEVVTDCTLRCTGPGGSGTGLPLTCRPGTGSTAWNRISRGSCRPMRRPFSARSATCTTSNAGMSAAHY